MNVNNALYSAEQVIDRSIIRSGEGHGGLVYIYMYKFIYK